MPQSKVFQLLQAKKGKNGNFNVTQRQGSLVGLVNTQRKHRKRKSWIKIGLRNLIQFNLNRQEIFKKKKGNTWEVKFSIDSSL